MLRERSGDLTQQRQQDAVRVRNDGVDGYLFLDVFKDPEFADGLYEGVEMGIKLVGLSKVSDFDFGDIVSIY